jgi:hypothetical protein
MDNEARLIRTLALMCDQYIGGGQGGLDHECVAAGEDAVELLVDYGLMEPSARGGTWTEKGLALLKS